MASGERTDVEKVRGFLHRVLRVQLSDGRLVEGTLECYDNLGNMILSNTTDVSNKSKSRRTHRLGLVLVPGHVQVSVKGLRSHEPNGSVWEQMRLMEVSDKKNVPPPSIL